VRAASCIRAADPSLGLQEIRVSSVALIPAGVFLGMIFVPQLIRWTLLLHTTFRLQEGDFLGAPKRRLLWFVPFVLVFHPLPYIAAGMVVVSALASAGRLAPAWSWFLGGFYAYSLLMVVLIVPKLLVLRKMHNNERKG
jgi:hypothetical protein